MLDISLYRKGYVGIFSHFYCLYYRLLSLIQVFSLQTILQTSSSARVLQMSIHYTPEASYYIRGLMCRHHYIPGAGFGLCLLEID